MVSNLLSFLILEGACENIGVLQTILFIKQLLKIVFILIPIGLIVMISVDFAKNVMASREDDMKKNLNLAIKRVMMAVALFLIPTLANFVVGLVDDVLESSIMKDFDKCWGVTSTSIEEQKEKNRANCTGENYYWDESTTSCVRKYTPPNIKFPSDPAKPVVNGNSSSVTNGEIVAYKQTDYPNVPFCRGGKTIKSSGCGAVALAMVASTLTSKGYDPEYVANWLCNSGHDNGALSQGIWYMPGGSGVTKIEDKFKVKNTQLFYSYTGNYSSERANALLSAVKSGKLVVLLISGHYIMIAQNSSCNGDSFYAYNFYVRTGCYNIESFKKATQGWDVTHTSNKGWRGAWAFEKAS